MKNQGFTTLALALVASFSASAFAAKGKDIVLDLSTAYVTSSGSGFYDSATTTNYSESRGTIEFPSITFETLVRTNVNTSVISAPADPVCPEGSSISIPLQPAQIWHLNGDGIMFNASATESNVVCVIPNTDGSGGSTTYAILNLEVSGGTGPYACASGNLAVRSNSAELPAVLQGLTTNNGLFFQTTAKGKGVVNPGRPTGTVTIPASCP